MYGKPHKNYRIPKYETENTDIRVETGYKPRPQQAFMHRNLKRFNVLVFHRRAGKTVGSVNEMIDKALSNTHHNPKYGYIAPTYRQAKMIVWEYFIDYTRNIPGVEINKSELTVTIHRPGTEKRGADKIQFILLGAENPDSLRGIYLDGVILDEYAQCDPSIWGEVVLPTLADRKGWAIFIGTPKGQNHFFDIYKRAQKSENWFHKMFKASETGILSQEELTIQREAMTSEEYDQEYECSFSAALMGAYYGELINRMGDSNPPRITTVTYNPNFPVDTFWDIGVGDDNTILFRQKIAGVYYYIDYYSNKGKGLPHYVDVLNTKAYVYGRHVFPHDLAVKEWGTGETRYEQARNLLGLTVETQKKRSLEDGINASRNRLACCFIDQTRCAKLIDALKNYEREWDSKHRIFKKTPLHNWASHGAACFRYSALDSRDSSFAKDRGKDLPKFAIMEYNEI